MRPEGCAEEPHGRRDPWQKVLWREQPGYPDNHTDATFLRSLSVSVQPERDFWRVVRGSAAVTQQMSTVAIACAAANYLLEVSSFQPVRCVCHAVGCYHKRTIPCERVRSANHKCISCRRWVWTHGNRLLQYHCLAAASRSVQPQG